MEQESTKISKFLSYVLRHKPDAIGLTFDENGWADIDELIRKSDQGLSREDIYEVVRHNDKQRFSISEDRQYICANQGHSISIDLDLKPQTPPEELYHGTVSKFIESIRSYGLKPKQRQHVHLSKDKETAKSVGLRRGTPIILKIKALEMSKAGYDFYLSKNGVWLTKHVPIKFVVFGEVT